MRRAFPLMFLAAAGATALVAWTVAGIDKAVRSAWRTAPVPTFPRSCP